MTSTASQRLRLDKQATGDNPDAWGDRLNGVIDLVDEAFGFSEIAVNGNVALSQQNFVSDQSRRLILRFTGAGGFAVTIPAVEHMYYIDNRCLADVVLKTSSTPGSTVVAGTKRIAYCDGATVTTDTSGGAPSASGVAFNPTGNLSATNVQAAIAELDSEKSALAGAAFTGAVTAPNLWTTGNLPLTVDSTNGARRILINGMYILSGTAIVSTDNGGLTNVVFPWAFPNVLVTALACNGDTQASALGYSYGIHFSDRTFMQVRIADGTLVANNIVTRINYYAMGY